MSGVERLPRLDRGQRGEKQVEHPPLMPPRPLAFRVVARVPIAFRFHPLGNLEFVVELKHRLLLFGKGAGAAGLAPAAG